MQHDHEQLCREIDEFLRLEREADDRHDFAENRRCLDDLWPRQILEHRTPADSDTGAIWKLRNAARIAVVVRHDTDQPAVRIARAMCRAAKVAAARTLPHSDLASLRTLAPVAARIDGEIRTSLASALEHSIAFLARPKVVGGVVLPFAPVR